MECEFCKNTFKTKDTLRSHQNTTKYCIKLQNRKKDIKTYTCASCKRSFTRIESFKRHEKTCKFIEIESQKEENKRLREENKRLREEIERLREEIESQKENTSEEVSSPEEMEVESHSEVDLDSFSEYKEKELAITEPLDLSREHIEPIAEKFTIDDAVKGQLGLVKFTHDNVLTTEDGKRKYICCDRSRDIYMYKGMNGEIVIDYQARNLIKAIEPIRKKAYDLLYEEILKAKS